MKNNTRIKVTIVPKELNQLIDQLVDKMVSEVTQGPIDCHGKTLQQLIPHEYNEDYDVNQGTCFQQNSSNLCGYHAIFNTFCVLQIINGGQCQYEINSGASFWRFKGKVEAFLTQYKKKYRRPDEWPWRMKDIEDGDFERTYNKACMQEFQQFKIFRKHQNFYYLTDTWEFQYQNLLGNESKIQELQTKMAQFYHYDGHKPLVIHLMLAITTHWLTFIGVKRNGYSQFWFFDSFNNKYLDFSWQQILDFVEKKSKDRIKYNKPEFTPFQKQSYSMCMKDIQTSLKLIIGCLKGVESLQAYAYNRRFNVFADHLEEAMTIGHERASFIIKDYEHNLRAFFTREIQWHLFTEGNHSRMKKFIQYSKVIRRQSRQGKYFNSLLSVHNKI